MSEKRASLEIIAPSVDEAVAKGLTELGLAEEDVEVEVMDSGAKGLFGLGFRQARVRLAIKSDSMEKQPPTVEEMVDSIHEQVYRDKRTVEPKAQEVVPETPEPPTPPEIEPVSPPVESPPESEKANEEERVLHLARETVEELLQKMKIDAQVTAHYGEPEDIHSRVPLLVDIHGDDLSILIGPKAETLNALQYIAGLIISKELGRAVPLVVDVEGYRVRRSQQIRRLASRMADQAVKSGRRQSLEPMPANERRLVHIELRNNPEVSTESVGEDPHRKVTIIPI